MTEHFFTKKLVLSALFAAPTCVTIMSIRTPAPGTGGYIHSDDAIVILYGVFLDPVSAFLAAGISSCMADLLGGCFIYVPVTFTIEDLVAFSASHICRSLRAREVNPYATVADYSVIGVALVTGGYYMCEVFLYGLGAALANVPSNIIQGISGLIISSVLHPILQKPFSMALKA